MRISGLAKTIAATAIGAGTVLTLAACGGAKQGTGPMAGLTNSLMDNLHADGYRGKQQLSLASDSVREVKRPDGSVQGSFDGTRLLRAADDHAYGTPTIIDATSDIKGDGIATFNEVRHVVRAFDGDGSLAFDNAEVKAFEAAVGVRWTPAGG